jgi:hypothetical protein
VPSFSERRVVTIVLVLLGAAYLVLALPAMTAPFGDNHDGRNAATWGAGSRALREEGPVESVLGAQHQDGTVYANHPPAILSLTAGAEVVGGEQPPATRAPALVASLAAIPLLYLVLRAVDLGRWPAAIGTAAAVSTPMFRTFGTMLDTPVIGLPVGLAVVLAWRRRGAGTPLPRWSEAAIGALAALAAWQCLLAVGIVICVTVVPSIVQERRVTRAAVRAMAPLTLGAAAGLAITLAWIALAHHGLADLGEVFLQRTGAGEGHGLSSAIERQRVWLPDLLGVAIIGLASCVAALAHRRHRTTAAVLLTSSLGMGVLMADGAAIHSYWLYWSVVPAAFGLAWAVDAVLTLPVQDLGLAGRLRPVAVAALALVAMAGPASRSVVHDWERAGADAGDLVAVADYPAGQDELQLVGIINPPAAWIDYEVGLKGVAASGRDDLEALADRRPDELVLLTTWCPNGPAGDTCRDVTGAASTSPRVYEILSAAEIAARLD